MQMLHLQTYHRRRFHGGVIIVVIVVIIVVIVATLAQTRLRRHPRAKRSSMAPKSSRGAHSGHVAAKRQKMAREAERLDQVEQTTEHRRGVTVLYDKLKAGDPVARNLLKRCQQQIEIAKVGLENEHRFCSDMEGRPLKRAPLVFLKTEWLPQLPDRVRNAPAMLKDAKVIVATTRIDRNAPSGVRL